MRKRVCFARRLAVCALVPGLVVLASCANAEMRVEGDPAETRSLADLRLSVLIEEGRFDEAIALADSLIARGADDAWLLGQKARGLAGIGSSAEAIALFEEALLKDYESCENHLHFATYLMRIGKTGRAETEFMEAKRFCEERHFPLIYRNLAVAGIKLGKRDRAMQQVDEGLRGHPDDPYLLGLKGMLVSREAPHTAESLFVKSRELGDASPEFLIQYGLLLINEGRPGEAVVILEDASSRRPDDEEIRLYLAEALDRAGRPREAETILRALGAGAGRPDLGERLARALFHAADFAGALEIYRTLEETPEIMDRIAMCLNGLGRLDEALTWARKAVAARPDWPQGMINLAVILAAKGEIDEASSLLERALELDPDNVSARANLDRLREARGGRPE